LPVVSGSQEGGGDVVLGSVVEVTVLEVLVVPPVEATVVVLVGGPELPRVVVLAVLVGPELDVSCGGVPSSEPHPAEKTRQRGIAVEIRRFMALSRRWPRSARCHYP
jgi:hypothetical protein